MGGACILRVDGMSDTSLSISLSLTENYAPSWKAWEGIREFVQNWYDGLLSSLDSLPPGRPEMKITEEILPISGKVRHALYLSQLIMLMGVLLLCASE